MPTLLTANAYIQGSHAARSKGGNAGNVLYPQETLMTRMWFCGEGNVQPCNLTAQELLGARGQRCKREGVPSDAAYNSVARSHYR